nr:2TM domain-containing protein [Clostridium ganghwense]
MKDEELYELARKRVNRKRSFFSNLTSYIVVCTGLGILNYFTSPEYWWFLWVVFGWGIGIINHGIGLYRFLNYDDTAVEREVEKLKKRGK